MSYNQLKHTINKLYRISNSAPRRNKEFSLGLLYTHNLMQQTHCAYSGRAFTDEDPSSFERVDNAVGYVDGNVVAVCTSLNSLRGSKTLSELKHELQIAVDSLEKSKSMKYVPKEANTREAKIQEMLNNPDEKFDTVRNYASCIQGSYEQIAAAKKEIDRVEEKRLHLNDPNYLQTHYANQRKIIKSRNDKIKNAHKSIDCIISKRFNGNMINVNPTINYEQAQSLIKDLTDTITGIEKFENLSRRQKLCVKFGIALDSSVNKLLKAWVVYNLS